MTVEINAPLLKSLLTLSTIIEARDAYTGGHTWRVSSYAELLARSLGLSDDQVTVARIGGLLHDLGKVGIPDAVLNKRDRLDEAEMEVMRRHPGIGETVIAQHPLSGIVRMAVTEHHERVDGKGYPSMKEGAEISVFGRILAIADSFDAMTSNRPYRAGMGKSKALAILGEEAGKQFDAAMVESFRGLDASGRLEGVLGHSAEGLHLLTCGGCGPIVARSRFQDDGQHIQCPACRGDFTLHRSGDDWVLEWMGVVLPSRPPVAAADLETVDDFLAMNDLSDKSRTLTF